MEKVGVGWVCFSGLGSGLGLVTIGLGSMKFGSIQTRVKFFSPYLGWVHKKIVRVGLGWPKGLAKRASGRVLAQPMPRKKSTTLFVPSVL